MANHFSEFDEYDVSSEYRPLGAWAYFGLSILFSIPVIGLIFLIVFSLSSSNINRRNYARSYFIGLFFTFILFAVLYFTGLYNETIQAMANGQYPSYLTWLPWA